MNEQQERADFEKDWRMREDNTLYCESAWRGWKARAALAAQGVLADDHTVDCIGLALDLEERSKVVDSQTTERAMLAAANGLRLLAAASAPAQGQQAGRRLAWQCHKCTSNGLTHATFCPQYDEAEAIAAVAAYTAAQAQQTEGLSMAQEPKYTVNCCAIINRASGEPIPSDEPVFVFRARDVHAREALEAYAAVILPGDHRDAVVQRIADFAAFAHANPARMKEPDTDQEAPAQAQQAADWTDVRMELEAAGRDDLSRFVESATEPAQAQQAELVAALRGLIDALDAKDIERAQVAMGRARVVLAGIGASSVESGNA